MVHYNCLFIIIISQKLKKQIMVMKELNFVQIINICFLNAPQAAQKIFQPVTQLFQKFHLRATQQYSFAGLI